MFRQWLLIWHIRWDWQNGYDRDSNVFDVLNDARLVHAFLDRLMMENSFGCFIDLLVILYSNWSNSILNQIIFCRSSSSCTIGSFFAFRSTISLLGIANINLKMHSGISHRCISIGFGSKPLEHILPDNGDILRHQDLHET